MQSSRTHWPGSFGTLRDMTMRRFSHSGLSCYEQCPHRYRLRYIDRVTVDLKESIACFRGSAAHAGIEFIYQEVMAGRLPTLDEVLTLTRQWWRKHFHENLLIPDGRPEDYLEEALACVRNYYQAHFPFTEDETVALEKRITADLDRRYGIVGYIDRLVRRNGQYEVHDFKTTTSPPRNDHPFSERQLAFYAMGVQAEHPEVRSVRLVWHYVFLDRVRSMDYPLEQAIGLKEATLQLIEEILSAKGFPRRQSKLCQWCEYLQACGLSTDDNTSAKCTEARAG